MRSIPRLASAVALAVALAVPAYAAVDATFVLRSGERLSGSLVDFSASGVTARMGGNTRTIRVDELAVIDFTHGSSYSPTEYNRVGGGVHALVLRNGSVMLGRLSDVGGSNPLRISFVADGATRDWVPTGRYVRQGQQIAIRTTGEVRLSGDASDIARPAGSVKGRYVGGSPLPSSLAGALIGRVGNSAPFGIGDQSSFSAPASGMLFLRVNDDNLADNTGEFGVELPMR
jgi:hypothetical protein